MNVTPALSIVAATEPDAKQALAFFAALYPSGRGEIIHMRGVPEPRDGRHPHNLHYALDEHFSDNVRGFLDWCRAESRAAFFLPGTVRGAGTGKADVESLPAILIDFDKGKPDDNLKAVEALLGPATLVVESGGVVEGQPKLHAYWRLTEPATGKQIEAACQAREALAVRFGGDPAFKQAAQVIRVPGSVHFKGEPKLVQLRTLRPEAVYQLDAIVAAAGPVPGKTASASSVFDFNQVDFTSKTERVLLGPPVHAGGTDDITRHEASGAGAGHFINMMRDPIARLSEDDAWKQYQEWAAVKLADELPPEKLVSDFQRILARDVKEKGPMPVWAVLPEQTKAVEGWSLAEWRIKRFQSEAPQRQWLVEGLIPAGTAGVFAAVGDAGKSMMALKLALHVATAPGVSGPIDVASPCFFGQPIVGRGAAVVLTAEDDAAEVHRRIQTLDSSRERDKDPNLMVVPMLATGGARSILVDSAGGPIETDFWTTLQAQLLAIPDLKLVVLDPLSSFVSADINKDNVAGAKLMTMLGELASKSGAAIMLVHHFAKAMVPTDLSDARSAIRGAGALVDNGRWALAMWEADQDKGKKILKALGEPERARQSGLVYFGGLAKGNAPGAKTMRTLVRSKATGLLEDQTDQIAAAVPRADEVDDKVLRALRKYKEERPRWVFPTGKTSVGKYIMPVLEAASIDVSERSVEHCLKRLRERGLIVETETPGKYEPTLE